MLCASPDELMGRGSFLLQCPCGWANPRPQTQVLFDTSPFVSNHKHFLLLAIMPSPSFHPKHNYKGSTSRNIPDPYPLPTTMPPPFLLTTTNTSLASHWAHSHCPDTTRLTITVNMFTPSPLVRGCPSFSTYIHTFFFFSPSLPLLFFVSSCPVHQNTLRFIS